MIKKLLIIIAIVLFSVSFASAHSFDAFLGASINYIDSVRSGSLYFQAYEGESIMLAALPWNYTSPRAFCGLSRMHNPYSVVVGYSTYYFFATAPADDLYVFLCLYDSGAPDDYLLAAVDANMYGMSSTQSVDKNSYPDELVKRLQDEMNKVVGR